MKLYLVELGVQIMVIKDESYAKKLKEERDEEDRVGRIARVKDAKAGSQINPQGKEKLGCERPGIFQKIAQRPRGLPQTVPVNLNAFQGFATLLESGTLRADDGNTISGIA